MLCKFNNRIKPAGITVIIAQRINSNRIMAVKLQVSFPLSLYSCVYGLEAAVGLRREKNELRKEERKLMNINLIYLNYTQMNSKVFAGSCKCLRDVMYVCG